MIEARLGEDKYAKHDMYSLVVDAMDDGKKMQLSEIWSEALFFFPAGTESVSTCISSLFFYLPRNPQSYHKLVEEIRATFKSGQDICGGPQLTGCEYLRACIYEALRMSPPGPGTFWRERSSTDDRSRPLVIDGYVIPEGTLLGVNIYTIHHNKEYFPDSFSFKPERSLASHTPEAQLKAMHHVFAAFLVGARGCGGKAMAYLETSLVVAKTLWYFDFEKASGKLGEVGEGMGLGRDTSGRGQKGEYQIGDIFRADHDGPNFLFLPRSETVKDITEIC